MRAHYSNTGVKSHKLNPSLRELWEKEMRKECKIVVEVYSVSTENPAWNKKNNKKLIYSLELNVQKLHSYMFKSYRASLFETTSLSTVQACKFVSKRDKGFVLFCFVSFHFVLFLIKDWCDVKVHHSPWANVKPCIKNLPEHQAVLLITILSRRVLYLLRRLIMNY